MVCVANKDSTARAEVKLAEKFPRNDVSEDDLNDFSYLVHKEYAFYKKMGMQFFTEFLA